jgi:hypothetical protein
VAISGGIEVPGYSTNFTILPFALKKILDIIIFLADNATINLNYSGKGGVFKNLIN